jgi:transcriptional regulator
MEWLAANAFNMFMFVTALAGGIAFSMNLDNRLKNIEKEQAETKQLVVVFARLDERINSVTQIMITQGKRLDRMIERVYGRRQDQDEQTD